ncbi:hypothetical protein KDW_45930 [Dictyobacter vulcani]|uniref:Uncharacterized protein n=1 Tax=Dictyobacter vulcani TaxID=2607529 RepID=A0A5J4KVF2_9CHLR|nr:hypothetical protein KDW_45930 [Dictyobacter vulcani]
MMYDNGLRIFPYFGSMIVKKFGITRHHHVRIVQMFLEMTVYLVADSYSTLIRRLYIILHIILEDFS